MTPRFEYFSTLRGLLAFWVLIGHLLVTEHYGTIYNAGFTTHQDFGLLGKMAMLHFVAVDLFFIISGYVLAMRYGSYFTKATKGKEIDRFYLQRLRRIWPLHALMVGCIGIFAYLGIPHPISSGLQDAVFQHWPWTLAVNLLLMNGWGMIPVASWNEPAWTLSVTFFLYVLFPNLILILRRIGTNRTLHCALIVALILGYWALRETVAQGGQSDGAGGLVRGLTFFLVGIAMARMEHLPNVRFGIPIFIVAALVWTYIYPFSMTLLHLTYPLLLISIIQTPRPLVPPRIANWMGEISFPLFISHYPVLLLIQHTMGNDLAALATQNGATKTLCYGLVIALCFLAAELLRRLDNRLHTHRRTRT